MWTTKTENNAAQCSKRKLSQPPATVVQKQIEKKKTSFTNIWSGGRGGYNHNMTRFRIKNLKILSCCLSLWVVLFGGALHLAQGSEFPERECCDLTTTSTVGPLPMPPAALPTDKSLSSATTALETDLAIGRSGKWLQFACTGTTNSIKHVSKIYLFISVKFL